MKFVFLTGPLANQCFEIDVATIIGRSSSNGIVLDDMSVSVVHCQISFDCGQAFIKDLGSTNGTYVNGQRVVSSSLNNNDHIEIGESEIIVELDETPVETAVLKIQPDPCAETVASESESGPHGTYVENIVDSELSGNIFGSVTYYLKRKIAKGGMGAIYDAEQFGADGFIKRVAIKTILPVFAKKDAFISSFVGEAKLVANLVHQNIVQIHHLGRHDDGYYIAMEYIDGINLTNFMAAHRRAKREVPVDIATFIVSRVCRGLEYAHGKADSDGESLGLVHRDVSPNNIMISKEGEVKLTDFGVAKALRFMQEEEDCLIGSVEYMSPEQAACVEVDRRSDLFSLGLVYYELLTGVRVFQCKDGDIEETVERVMKAKVPHPEKWRKDLPQNVVDILSKCLQKKVDKRYQTAGELGYDLEHEIYSKGYGPTIVSLAKYIDKMKTGWSVE